MIQIRSSFGNSTDVLRALENASSSAYELSVKLQKFYNKLLQLYEATGLLKCPFCGDSLRHFEYVSRTVRTKFGLVPFIILREKCRHCNRTHRIIPDFVVPFSRSNSADFTTLVNTVMASSPIEPSMAHSAPADNRTFHYEADTIKRSVVLDVQNSWRRFLDFFSSTRSEFLSASRNPDMVSLTFRISSRHSRHRLFLLKSRLTREDCLVI